MSDPTTDERDTIHQWAALVFNPAWGIVEETATEEFQKAVEEGMDVSKSLDLRNAASGRAQVWNKVLTWGRQWRAAHAEMIAEQAAEKEPDKDTGNSVEEQWYDHDPDAVAK